MYRCNFTTTALLSLSVLCSAQVSFANIDVDLEDDGTLIVETGRKLDVVFVHSQGNELHVQVDEYDDPGPNGELDLSDPDDSETRLYERSEIQAIIVRTFAGRSTIFIDASCDVTVETGDDEDQVIVIGAGRCELLLGDGDDSCAALNCYLPLITAEAGDDRLFVSDCALATVNAGDGDDYVKIGRLNMEFTIDGYFYESVSNPNWDSTYTVRGEAGDDEIIGECSGSYEFGSYVAPPTDRMRFYGGDGNDLLVGGTEAANTFYGQGGDDILEGGNLYDYLNGGSGNDDLFGASPYADDIAKLDGAVDTMVGGNGADRFFDEFYIVRSETRYETRYKTIYSNGRRVRVAYKVSVNVEMEDIIEAELVKDFDAAEGDVSIRTKLN